MNNQYTEPMVDLVIENLHLLGYTVIGMDENTVTLDHLGKALSLPTYDFMELLYVHIGAIKHRLDKLSK